VLRVAGLQQPLVHAVLPAELVTVKLCVGALLTMEPHPVPGTFAPYCHQPDLHPCTAM
jgi:hypothetical protein